MPNPWEHDNRLFGQNILRLSRNAMVQYRVQKSTKLDWNQVTPLHPASSRCVLILSTDLRLNLQEVPPLSSSPTKILYSILLSP